MDALPPAAHEHRPAIVREAQFRFGVPAPVPVIAAQIHQESAWRADAKSPVGARGLMQFMPSTAEWAQAWCGPADMLNAAWSIRCGVWYDRWLYERVRDAATECDRWHFTLSAYNGGLGWVQRRQQRSPKPGDAATTLVINPGIQAAAQRENAEYPKRILLQLQPKYVTWGKTVCLSPK